MDTSVSVLLANYNNAQYIRDCYDSLARQTHSNFEIVIVDDFSQDNSDSIIRSIVAKDPRVLYCRNAVNRGVGYAKRICIDKARGEILMFVDPDDAVTGDAVDAMVEAHSRHADASLVYSRFYKCDSRLKILGVDKDFGPIPDRSSNLKSDRITHLASFKRSFYNLTAGLDVSLRAAIDKDLYYRLEEVGYVIFIDRPLYLYRSNPHGVSQENNAIKAEEYHLKAISSAFQRRKKTMVGNITYAQIRHRKAKLFYTKALHQWMVSRQNTGAGSWSIFVNILQSFYCIPFGLHDKIRLNLLLSALPLFGRFSKKH